MDSKPWIFRTYAGHSSASASNKLFKDNLSKGQTGLSIAFDLPTQTGYDSDHQLARGEVGKVGVPINHLGDMRKLFKDIPEAIANIKEIVQKVDFYDLNRDVLLPKFTIPNDFSPHTDDIENEYLKHITYLGAKKVYQKIDDS